MEKQSTAVSKKDDSVLLIGTKMKTQDHGSTFHSNEKKRKNQAIVSIKPQNNVSADANRSLSSSPVVATPESASPDTSTSPGTIIGTRDYYYYYTFLVVGVMVSTILVASLL